MEFQKMLKSVESLVERLRESGVDIPDSLTEARKAVRTWSTPEPPVGAARRDLENAKTAEEWQSAYLRVGEALAVQEAMRSQTFGDFVAAAHMRRLQVAIDENYDTLVESLTARYNGVADEFTELTLNLPDLSAVRAADVTPELANRIATARQHADTMSKVLSAHIALVRFQGGEPGYASYEDALELVWLVADFDSMSAAAAAAHAVRRERGVLDPHLAIIKAGGRLNLSSAAEARARRAEVTEASGGYQQVVEISGGGVKF